jgi:hypothetical protein
VQEGGVWLLQLDPQVGHCQGVHQRGQNTHNPPCMCSWGAT